jgi:hypothetical protein
MDGAVREQLMALLKGGQAHVSFDDAVADFPEALRGRRVDGVPYTAWQYLEHIRIAQHDIVDFSRNPHYKPMSWPADYWPESEAPPTAEAWDQSIAAIRADLLAMQALLADPSTDLFTPFAWGEGQNLMREAMLMADHSAYHLGQFVLLRRLLGAWPEE